MVVKRNISLPCHVRVDRGWTRYDVIERMSQEDMSYIENGNPLDLRIWISHYGIRFFVARHG